MNLLSQLTRFTLREQRQLGCQLIDCLRHDFRLAFLVSIFAIVVLAVVFAGLAGFVAATVTIHLLAPLVFFWGVRICAMAKVDGFYVTRDEHGKLN